MSTNNSVGKSWSSHVMSISILLSQFFIPIAWKYSDVLIILDIFYQISDVHEYTACNEKGRLFNERHKNISRVLLFELFHAFKVWIPFRLCLYYIFKQVHKLCRFHTNYLHFKHYLLVSFVVINQSLSQHAFMVFWLLKYQFVWVFVGKSFFKHWY